MTEDEIRTALTGREVLSLTLYGESRGEPVEGSIAIACVIRNRAGGGQDVKDVCLAPHQFSCWNRDGSANHTAILAVAEQALNQDHAASTNVDRVYAQCLWIADGVLSGVVLDRSFHATHYLERSLFETGTVSWASAMHVTTRIGRHVFLRSGAA